MLFLLSFHSTSLPSLLRVLSQQLLKTKKVAKTQFNLITIRYDKNNKKSAQIDSKSIVFFLSINRYDGNDEDKIHQISS